MGVRTHVVCLTAWAVICCSSMRASDRPNVLFILADDLGWGDLGCFGNPHVDTPAIDGLAERGVRLTAHYSPSPLCAPARAGFLTGRYNHRTGAVDVPSNRGLDRISLKEKTFGDYFSHAGYRTAMIGKWHNGLYCRDYLPHNRGFDLFFGFANGGQDYWKWNLQRNDGPESHDGRYLSDALNEETVRFIQQSARQETPFAVFLAHHTPHVPLQAPQALVKKYARRLGPDADRAVAVVYAMIEAMDAGLAKVFEALHKEGVYDNTIVVFTSDNGPSFGRDGRNPNWGTQKRFNGRLNGEKQWSLEGGIRVPAIVSWPAALPQGTTVSSPIHGCDWLPTLFALTGTSMPDDALPFDGMNVFPVLNGHSMPEATERSLYFQRNRYAPVARSNAAIRRGRWKLYWAGSPDTLKKESGRDNPSYLRGVVHPHWEMPMDRQLAAAISTPQPAPKLFDLETDPEEKRDLAAVYPDVVRSLSAAHDAWFRNVHADWRKSRAGIVEHDISYWSDKTVPDARELFEDFWQWRRAPAGTDPAVADPLRVFSGYWSLQ